MRTLERRGCSVIWVLNRRVLEKREFQKREELLMIQKTSTNEDVTSHSNVNFLPSSNGCHNLCSSVISSWRRWGIILARNLSTTPFFTNNQCLPTKNHSSQACCLFKPKAYLPLPVCLYTLWIYTLSRYRPQLEGQKKNHQEFKI